MPYNANSMSNLQPFTGKDDSRRQNGRKPGSKNIKTMIRKLLESEVDLSLPINDDMKKCLSGNSGYSYMEAVTLAMIIKAINGDARAASLLYGRSDQIPEEGGFFDAPVINFRVVDSPYKDLEKESSEI